MSWDEADWYSVYIEGKRDNLLHLFHYDEEIQKKILEFYKDKSPDEVCEIDYYSKRSKYIDDLSTEERQKVELLAKKYAVYIDYQYLSYPNIFDHSEDDPDLSITVDYKLRDIFYFEVTSIKKKY